MARGRRRIGTVAPLSLHSIARMTGEDAAEKRGCPDLGSQSWGWSPEAWETGEGGPLGSSPAGSIFR